MKQIKIVLVMMILTGLCSCRKNLLDVQPTNLLTNAQIMTNDASVTAYMASLYRDLPMEDFSFCEGSFWRFPDGGNQYLANLTDEAQTQWNNPGPILNVNVYDVLYKAVRNVNTFISLMQATTNFPAAQQAQYIAEAKFIRAYYYYGLVKNYGGVPLVLTVPATATPLPRNKETDIYDQIKKDLDDASAGLPAVKAGFLSTTTSVNGVSYGYGRANKYVALALEARAMLHAGSIGFFTANDPNYAAVIGSYNGICGVDAAHGQTYMQAAFDASAQIIASGVFQLYTKYAGPGLATAATAADYAKNFQYLFYDTKQGDSNTESIFNRGYDFATSNSYTHSQDLETLPHAIQSAIGYGNALQPTADLMEKFENIDQSSPIIAPTPTLLYHFPNQNTPFALKDPRFNGTFVANNTAYRGTVITAQRGVILGGAQLSSSNYAQYFDTKVGSSTYKQFNADPTKFNAGDTYIVGSGNSSNGDQSAWLKKWGDPITDISLIHDYSSRTSWMDLRYGEVLLDYAEASFELGHATTESLAVINQLRARAGIFALTAVSRAIIRHERLVETPFENKNWWDYVRWRSFATDFNNRQEYNIQCWFDIDTNDYVYIKVNDGGPRIFNYKYYYADIPSQDVSTDALLVPNHNPGY
jgi:hypothetical protein